MAEAVQSLWLFHVLHLGTDAAQGFARRSLELTLHGLRGDEKSVNFSGKVLNIAGVMLEG